MSQRYQLQVEFSGEPGVMYEIWVTEAGRGNLRAVQTHTTPVPSQGELDDEEDDGRYDVHAFIPPHHGYSGCDFIIEGDSSGVRCGHSRSHGIHGSAQHPVGAEPAAEEIACPRQETGTPLDPMATRDLIDRMQAQPVVPMTLTDTPNLGELFDRDQIRADALALYRRAERSWVLDANVHAVAEQVARTIHEAVPDIPVDGMRLPAAMAVLLWRELMDSDGGNVPAKYGHYSPQTVKCAGYIPMGGFGETRCRRCGLPLARHPVQVQP